LKLLSLDILVHSYFNTAGALNTNSIDLILPLV